MKYWYAITYTLLLIGTIFLSSGCTSPDTNPIAVDMTATSPFTSDGGNLTPSTPTTVPTPKASSHIPDAEAINLMYQLSQIADPEFQAAFERIIDAHDERFIAVFIELFRANQLALLQSTNYQTPINALETLRGQSLGNNWPA